MKVVYIIISLIIGFVIGYNIGHPKTIAIQPIEKEKTIRDSLHIVNDTLKNKIEYITHKYYEKRDSIIRNDSSADMQFFTDYIDSYQRANQDR